MTLRMKGDPLVPAPVAVNPQRNLLSHRPGRHPHRRFFAKQCGDPSLQPFRERALPVAVNLLVRRRSLRQSTQCCPRVTFGGRKRADNPFTSSPDCRSILLCRHESSLLRAHTSERGLASSLANLAAHLER
jgi:hypothetical protein